MNSGFFLIARTTMYKKCTDSLCHAVYNDHKGQLCFLTFIKVDSTPSPIWKPFRTVYATVTREPRFSARQFPQIDRWPTEKFIRLVRVKSE